MRRSAIVMLALGLVLGLASCGTSDMFGGEATTTVPEVEDWVASAAIECTGEIQVTVQDAKYPLYGTIYRLAGLELNEAFGRPTNLEDRFLAEDKVVLEIQQLNPGMVTKDLRPGDIYLAPETCQILEKDPPGVGIPNN